MIGINNKKLFYMIKVGIVILVAYILVFIALQGIKYINIINSQNQILQEIESIKEQTEQVKARLENSKKQFAIIEESYIKQDELETRIKGIFERMSVLDFEIRLVTLKQLCVDRYIFMVQILSYSEEGRKAAHGILSYLGNVQLSADNDTLYYVDYVVAKKEN